MKYDCVGLGIIAFDFLCKIGHFPKSNTKNKILTLNKQGGGPVPTALATLGKLEKSCTLISKLGADENAEYLLSELNSYNVNTDNCVQVDDVETPTAFILTEAESGNRTIFLYRDKRLNLTGEDVRREAIQNARILHIDGHETDACMLAAKWAKEAEMEVSIDIGSSRPISKELFELTDYAIVSEAYADAHLTPGDAKKSIEKLFKLGVQIAGVTLDIKGSYFFDGKDMIYQPAFHVETIDSTGAGDVFHGAFLYGILQGYSLRDIAIFASAASALKCRHVGGKLGIPTLDEIINFLKEKSINAEAIERKEGK